MEDDNIVNNLPKLKWACRRGMLELDVLLSIFLEGAYSSLDLTDKKLFIKLLNCSDPQLFAWLLGQEVPDDKELAKITDIIRHYARSRI